MSQRVHAIDVQNVKLLTATITRPANTTAYAIGDAISNVTDDELFTFNHVFQEGARSGSIERYFLASSANVATKLTGEIWVFHTKPTLEADNAPWTPTDAEILTHVAILPLLTADWNVGDVTVGAGGNAVNQRNSLDQDVPVIGKLASNKVSLYAQLVAGNAYIPVTSEVFTLGLMLRSD